MSNHQDQLFDNGEDTFEEEKKIKSYVNLQLSFIFEPNFGFIKQKLVWKGGCTLNGSSSQDRESKSYIK